jgi:hypothetical protein
MTKNRFTSLIVTTLLFIEPSIALAAEQAAVVAKTPLKATPSFLGGKVVRQLEPGVLVKVVETKGNFSKVELADDPSVKGWVSTPSISKNKNVLAGVANMKAAHKVTSDTKGRIASSMGAVAKGVSDISPAAQAAASSVKDKSASLKKDVGAVVKGKSQNAREALENEVGAYSDEVKNAAAETAAKFKGKSASTLEKIEALKISESEISRFMKEGGLRSRLIR